MSTSRFALLAIALAATPTILQAQKDDARWLRECPENRYDNRERFCEVRHTGFKSTGSVDVDPGANGGVSIVGWDRDSVDITLRIEATAGSMAEAKAIAADIEIAAKNGQVRVDGPVTQRRQSWGANLVMRVPNRSNLDVGAENGPIGVSDVSGTMRLKTTNGPVSLENVGGDVRARLQNGPLTVSLTGKEWKGAGLDAESVNGPVTLSIPADYNAELETGTVNGPMQSSRPLTVTFQGRMKSRIQTTLGKGGAPVRVVTTNGPITIE